MQTPQDRTNIRQVLFLLLALLVSQAWLNEHALEHSLAGELNDCVICLHLDHQGHALLNTPDTSAQPYRLIPSTWYAGIYDVRFIRHFASRAPPHQLTL